MEHPHQFSVVECERTINGLEARNAKLLAALKAIKSYKDDSGYDNASCYVMAKHIATNAIAALEGEG